MKWGRIYLGCKMQQRRLLVLSLQLCEFQQSAQSEADGVALGGPSVERIAYVEDDLEERLQLRRLLDGFTSVSQLLHL